MIPFELVLEGEKSDSHMYHSGGRTEGQVLPWALLCLKTPMSLFRYAEK